MPFQPGIDAWKGAVELLELGPPGALLRVSAAATDVTLLDATEASATGALGSCIGERSSGAISAQARRMAAAAVAAAQTVDLPGFAGEVCLLASGTIPDAWARAVAIGLLAGRVVGQETTSEGTRQPLGGWICGTCEAAGSPTTAWG